MGSHQPIFANVTWALDFQLRPELQWKDPQSAQRHRRVLQGVPGKLRFPHHRCQRRDWSTGRDRGREGGSALPARRQWARVRRLRPAILVLRDGGDDVLYRARTALDERTVRGVQLEAAGRVLERRALRFGSRSKSAPPSLPNRLQPIPPPQLSRLSQPDRVLLLGACRSTTRSCQVGQTEGVVRKGVLPIPADSPTCLGKLSGGLTHTAPGPEVGGLAASLGSGRYPTSSITNKRGPAKKCMVFAHLPASAARWQRATRSAAVV